MKKIFLQDEYFLVSSDFWDSVVLLVIYLTLFYLYAYLKKFEQLCRGDSSMRLTRALLLY
jgi:hypothetical protein